MAASSSTRGNHEDVISSPTGISKSDGHSEYETNMDNSFYDSDKVDDSSFSSCLMTETKEKFTSQFSLPKMRKLIDKLTDAQKDIVTMCGFGSLLHLKCAHVPKQLVYWLAKNYDAKSKSVKLPGGGSFSLDSFTVHQILGIPFRGRQVQKKATKCAKDLIGKDTSSAVTGAKVDDLLKIVTPDLLGDKFARIFMLIALSLFLCPSSNTRTSLHFYSALCVVKEIASYDWSSMVLDWLVGKIKNFQVAASKGNTCGVVSLGGCIFVLFATYFDYLDTSEVKVEGSIPRLISWDDDAVQAYELIDRKFQEAKLKSIESTLFDKKHAIPVNFRGYGVLDGGSGSVSRARGKQSALKIGKPPPPMGNTEHIKSIQRSRLLKSQVDKGNFEASLLACPSHMNSTRIVSNVAKCNTHLAGCSKVSVSANDDGIHPDVEDFINNTITGSNNEHVRIKMREMCKQFPKTSTDRCVEALQPVIAQQSCEMIGFLWSEMMQGSKSGKHISQQNRFEMNIASARDASAINKEIGTVSKNFAAGNDQNRPISEGHCSKCSCHVSVLDKGQHICLVCNEAISTKDINSSSDMNLSSKLLVVSTVSPKVKGHGICTSGHIVDHANPNSDPSSNNGPSAPTQLISQPSVKPFATSQIKLKSNEYASTSAGDEMQFIH